MKSHISRNGTGKNVTMLKTVLMKIHVAIVMLGIEGMRNR